jgi:hypothetical protein
MRFADNLLMPFPLKHCAVDRACITSGGLQDLAS